MVKLLNERDLYTLNRLKLFLNSSAWEFDKVRIFTFGQDRLEMVQQAMREKEGFVIIDTHMSSFCSLGQMVVRKVTHG